jgi:hypothetical protein
MHFNLKYGGDSLLLDLEESRIIDVTVPVVV